MDVTQESCLRQEGGWEQTRVDRGIRGLPGLQENSTKVSEQMWPPEMLWIEMAPIRGLTEFS